MIRLDTGLERLRETAAAAAHAPLTSISIAEARARVTAGNLMCAAGPELDSVIDFEIATPHGVSIPVRLYQHGPSPDLMVYAHGGAWFTGDLDYADELCRFLARDARCRVLSVNYRLAPESPWPAPLADLRAAVAWAADELVTDGAFGVGGDSAGGNLAASAAVLCASEDGPELDFQVLVYPVLDASMSYPSYQVRHWPIGLAEMSYAFDLYVPDTSQRDDPAVSPITYEFPGLLPPTLIVAAGHDPLHDEALAYAQRLNEADVSVSTLDLESMSHGFLRFTGAAPAAGIARDSVVAAARDLLDGLRSPSLHASGGRRCL